MKRLIYILLTILLIVIVVWSQPGSRGGGNGVATQFSFVQFANLGTPPDGGVRWCTDCNPVNPCTGAGSGAMAFRAISQWNCAGTGTSSPMSNALTNTHIFVGNAGNVATDVAMSGDASMANTGALTLATVNANVGTFGTATQAPSFTVNAKGLITAAGSNTVTPAESSITFTDITTNNFSTTKHGFVPKGTNVGNFLKDDGTWASAGASPAGSNGDLQMKSGSNLAAAGINDNGTVYTIAHGTWLPSADSNNAFRIRDAGNTTNLLNVNSNTFATTLFSLVVGNTASDNNTWQLSSTTPEIRLWNGGCSGWSGTASPSGTGDTSQCRAAAKVVEIGDGGTNSNGWITFAGRQCFLQADQTNATTTFASINNCTINVISGRRYTGRGIFYVNDSIAADGAKVDFNGGSAGVTNFRAHCTAFDTALGLSSQGTALSTAYSVSTLTGNGYFECYVTFEPSSSGTFIPRFAQANHSTGTLTLARGSHLLFEDHGP
jgi:hypothetical protein